MFNFDLSRDNEFAIGIREGNRLRVIESYKTEEKLIRRYSRVYLELPFSCPELRNAEFTIVRKLKENDEWNGAVVEVLGEIMKQVSDGFRILKIKAAS